MVETVVELVPASRVSTGVDKDDGPVETGGTGGLVPSEGLKDGVAAEIAFAHFRIGIVGVGADTGRKIDQLPAKAATPGCDCIVPPFIGRYKIMRTGGIDAEGMDGCEIVLEIGAEAVGSDEGAVAADPVGVEQVSVRVGT